MTEDRAVAREPEDLSRLFVERANAGDADARRRDLPARAGRRRAGRDGRRRLPRTRRHRLPRDLIRLFVERANGGDADGLAVLYEPDAVLAYPPGLAAAEAPSAPS